jgi:hypothetical protein
MFSISSITGCNFVGIMLLQNLYDTVMAWSNDNPVIFFRKDLQEM